MSFCRLCGAGFEFVGEHKPGCEAVTPKPPAAPETCPTCRRPWSECTAASRCTAPAPELPEVDPADIVSTCTQCGAVCEANLANIMALLATQGLTIVGAKGRAVLEDEREMAALLQTRAFHQEIPERYRPKSTTQRLAYLVEECGEVLAAAGKSQRWGLESYNPDLPPDERETNAAWLLREMHDLKRAISLIENDGAVWAQAELARREKA